MSFHAPAALKSGNPFGVKNLYDYIQPACENEVKQPHNLSGALSYAYNFKIY